MILFCRSGWLRGRERGGFACRRKVVAQIRWFSIKDINRDHICLKYAVRTSCINESQSFPPVNYPLAPSQGWNSRDGSQLRTFGAL